MTRTRPTVGSMCSGIGGLELGIERAFGARTIWHAEVDQHAATVLAPHWPTIPNYGDLTTTDWATVETPDIVCFGFPCQDISHAGRRAGIEGDRSALWFACADAVRVLRPRHLLVENVSALLVRGIDRVTADLAEMGYVGRWGCLRSSDIGAPHRRERVFIAATDAENERREGGGPARRRGNGSADRGDVAPYPDDQRLEGVEEHDSEPGPGVDPSRRRHADRRGDAASDADGGRLGAHFVDDAQGEPDAAWGRYSAAIERWERLHGPAPAPRDGRGRLNPALPEWMLGYPAGWVTGLPIPRTAQLRVLGNSVQPQVSEAAARLLLVPLLDLGEPT